MADASVKYESPEQRADRAERKRPWPLTAVSLLLLGQIAGYIILIVWIADEAQDMRLADLFAPGGAAELAVQLVAFGVLTLVAFFALVTVIRRTREAWHHVMFAQGLSLMFGLLLYFGPRLFYAYIILAYAVFVVFYLMVPGVQVAFLPFEDESDASN